MVLSCVWRGDEWCCNLGLVEHHLVFILNSTCFCQTLPGPWLSTIDSPSSQLPSRMAQLATTLPGASRRWLTAELLGALRTRSSPLPRLTSFNGLAAPAEYNPIRALRPSPGYISYSLDSLQLATTTSPAGPFPTNIGSLEPLLIASLQSVVDYSASGSPRFACYVPVFQIFLEPYETLAP